MKEAAMKEAGKFIEKQNEFYAKYPDCPRGGVIPCLNLILKLDNAIDILRGTKKFEWRTFSEYYINRLCNTKFFDYADEHADDEEFNAQSQYAQYLHDVEKVRFHDYNGEWFLEVEVNAVHDVFATMENARYFVDQFNCHDLDEEAAFCARHPELDTTEFFALELGQVLATNLDEMPEDRKKKKK